MTPKKHRNIEKTIVLRVYLLFIGLCVFAVSILYKVIQIQVREGDKLNSLFEKKNIALKNIEAIRGNIYASDKQLLSTSIPIYDIRFDTRADGLSKQEILKNISALAEKLSATFKDKSTSEYKNTLKEAVRQKSRYHLIQRNISYSTLQKVKQFPIFNKGRFKGGLIIERKSKRAKPYKALASRTIGYKSAHAAVGIEGAYNEVLAGTQGKRVMKRLSGGVWMPLNQGNEIDPKDGYDVRTTLDVNLQDVAHQALEEQLKKHNADHGCVVLIEVQTGDIKAIVNLSRNQKGSYSEKYNYAVGESTEPGSTFKLASIAVALEDGYIDPNDSIETGGGSQKFHNATMRDSRAGGYGKITLQNAIEVSSNIAVAKTIVDHYQNNPQKFINGLYKMGLNKKTGIEISGEGTPYIKSVDKDWSGISLPWISHGYEISLTPLQILTFYNAIANNGVMVKPRLVTEILDKEQVIRQIEKEVLNPKICSQKTIDHLKNMLIGVVENGTAKNLRNSYFKIAGKTGTAQIYNEKYGYEYDSKVSYQASFAGYFPAENPKYSCIVVVNAPSNNVYYGNLVAGPIFKELADKVYATSIELHPEIIKETTHPLYPKTTKLMPQDETVLKDKLGDVAGLKHIAISKTAYNTIPNTTGMTLKDAMYLLELKGYTVQFSGKGKVKTQKLIDNNGQADEPKTIHLTLS